MPIQTGQCPKCHTVNAYSAVLCLECQGRLPWADAVEEMQAKLKATAQAAADAQAARSQQPPSQAITPTGRVGGALNASTIALPNNTSPAFNPQVGGVQMPVNTYETFIGSFLGKFSRGFSDLDDQSALLVGLFCGFLYSISFIIGAYMIRYQIQNMFGGLFSLATMGASGLGSSSEGHAGSVMGAVTAKGVAKLFMLTLVTFFSIAVSSALIRKLFSDEEGSFSGDIFVAGLVLMPAALVVLITGIVGVSNWEVAVILSVAALCYTIILLYNGCTIIGRIRDTAAAVAVPVMILLSGWITKVILMKMLSSGQL